MNNFNVNLHGYVNKDVFLYSFAWTDISEF